MPKSNVSISKKLERQLTIVNPLTIVKKEVVISFSI